MRPLFTEAARFALRRDFDLPGTPIRMMLRKGTNPYEARRRGGDSGGGALAGVVRPARRLPAGRETQGEKSILRRK